MYFGNNNGRRSHSEYYLRKVEKKDYNVLIGGKKFFDQLINNDTKTYGNIRKISTGQEDHYTSGCLLDYPNFKENYKIIAIHLSKQQALDTDPRAIQHISLTTNLDRAGYTTMFFVIEEAKETVLDFLGDINVKVELSNCATKSDLKNTTGVDTSKFAKQVN